MNIKNHNAKNNKIYNKKNKYIVFFICPLKLYYEFIVPRSKTRPCS